MKRILTLSALAALLLTACQSLKTETYQDNLTIPLAEGQTDSLIFDISLQYVSGGVSDAAKEAINNAIILHSFDLEEADGTLEEIAIRYRDNLIEEYFSVNAGGDDYDCSWEDSMKGEFTGGYKNWENYSFTYYSYRGGAHGFQTTIQMVFDRKTGALLTEDDLFAKGYQNPVSELLREAILAEMSAEADDYSELVDMENVVPNGNFSVGKEGILWFFQPYEIMPYALGPTTCTIPWDRLKPYLK